MLVLSRRPEERIMIGNDIVITVLEIHHDHVRIGIDAPRSIDVHREEVYRLVKAANVAAATKDDAEGPARLEGLRGLGQDAGPAGELGSPNVARIKRPVRDDTDQRR